MFSSCCRISLRPFLWIAWIFSILFISNAAFAETMVSGVITKDTTWSLAGSPYIVTSTLTVRGRDGDDDVTTLILEPGVEVRFHAHAQLVIGGSSGDPGALIARGREGAPIRFVAHSTEPGSGYWRGIHFQKTGKGSVEHSIISHAGRGGVPALAADHAAPLLSFCHFTENLAYDLRYSGDVGGVLYNSILNNGLDFRGQGEVLFDANTVYWNHAFPVRLPANNTGSFVAGAEFLGLDADSAIVVWDSSLSRSSTWQSSIPYALIAGLYVRGRDGREGVTTLTLEPGTELRFNTGFSLVIGSTDANGEPGALIARGSSAFPIRFVANTREPVPGYWQEIQFLPSSEGTGSRMDHCMVAHAGRGGRPAVFISHASPALSSCYFTENLAYDLRYSGYVGGVLYNSTLHNGLDFGGQGEVLFDANTVYWNHAFPVRLPANNTGPFVAGAEFLGLDADSAIVVWDPNLSRSSIWQSSIPYALISGLYVQGRDGGRGVTTLTLKPGTELRFNAATAFVVGNTNANGEPGALIARGSSDFPIRFVANTREPVPGYWQEIQFLASSEGTGSRMDHCMVAHAGRRGRPAVFISHASPALSYCHFTENLAYDLRYSGDVGGVLYNSTLHNGLDFEGRGEVLFDANTVYWNHAFPVRLPADLTGAFVAGAEFLGLDADSAIVVRDSSLSRSSTWQSSIPYALIAGLYVRGRDGREGVTTLTLEPGTELRFNSGSSLGVGSRYDYSDPGALIARGTTDAPILFTANTPFPFSGFWRGILFDRTAGENSVLEHAVVEYGGYGGGQNIYALYSSPAIRFSTIQNSSGSGIRLYGQESSNISLECNTIRKNEVGITAQMTIDPVIRHNHFIQNRQCGLEHTGGQGVIAAHNWWGDPHGPGYTGDWVSGNVVVDPWLEEPGVCAPDSMISDRPFVPRNPRPLDEAAELLFPGREILLEWDGGDPDPKEKVHYLLLWGRDENSLTVLAEGLDRSFFSLEVEPETTYFWRVVSRNSHGLETHGPVWRFTTAGAQADLVVSHLSWDPPAGIEAGQQVAVTATITNQGAGPAVSRFEVGFYVNGSHVGRHHVQGLAAGESIQLGIIWSARVGPAVLRVVADIYNNIVEDDEGNNSYEVSLGSIADTTPPEMYSSTPAHGALIHQVSQVDAHIRDLHGGRVNSEVTLQSLVLSREGRLIPGTRRVSGDCFSFIPSTLPMDAGLYRMDLRATDLAGNHKDYFFEFTIKPDRPSSPVITGDSVFSGPVLPRPEVNYSNIRNITLRGERDDDTWVRIRRGNRIIAKTATGSGPWSVYFWTGYHADNLYEGINHLEIQTISRAGAASDPVWVDVFVDVMPPALTAFAPAVAFLNYSPERISLSWREHGVGFDAENSWFTVKNERQNSVPGTWTLTEDTAVFVPEQDFSDDVYTVEGLLVDKVANASGFTRIFTVDRVAPGQPVVEPVFSPTHTITQILRGQKEAFSALSMNGEPITGHTAALQWEHRVRLQQGLNQFVFTAKDRAGNVSPEARVRIVFDDIPPPSVQNLTASGDGNGTTVLLDWIGYNEALHGDIERYLIFCETTPFSSVEDREPCGVVNAGIFSYVVQNLARGRLYWFAVVAVDEAGNMLKEVTPVSAIPVNRQAPLDVVNLSVHSFADRLYFTWQSPENQHSDLEGYRIYFNNSLTPEILGADATSYEKVGLAEASAYTFQIRSVNSRGMESLGVSTGAHTWLSNPSGLSIRPEGETLLLRWDPVEPVSSLRHYAVYQSSAPFTSTEGMKPVLVVTGTQAGVAGLTSHETYYLAVAAVNRSGGQNPHVESLGATPQSDEEGPLIMDVMMDGRPLEEGFVIADSGLIRLRAEDPSGVSRIEFFLDDVLHHTDYGSPYSWRVNIHELEDRSYTFRIVAHDSLNNISTFSRNIRIQMNLPTAPRISEPRNGWIVNRTEIQVRGETEEKNRIQLYLNGEAWGGLLVPDRKGHFEVTLLLASGSHSIQAAAVNRSGMGPLSEPVSIEVDVSVPSTPAKLSAEALEGGGVRLAWSAGDERDMAGYTLYRSAASFTDAGGAGRVNARPIAGLHYRDMPPEDGLWYYRITVTDRAGNESALSEEVSVVSDGTGPRASIYYESDGRVHPVNGAFGRGRVRARIQVSEPLMAAPFFGITPHGGQPFPMELRKTGALEYEGYFDMEASTPSGRALAVFSARDLVGNRGTEIDLGMSLQIDTDGPVVRRLVLDPAAPVHNNASPLRVEFTAGLDKAVADGSSPEFSFFLFGKGRKQTEVADVRRISTVHGDAETWKGHLDLPLDAGVVEPEMLSFVFLARCLLDNEGSQIAALNRFQVYAGELPPLAPPSELEARALPGGGVALSWRRVEESSGCRIYRRDGGRGDFALIGEVEGDVEGFEDRVAEDGRYTYVLTSLRRENGEEAESAFSEPAEILALVSLPPAPYDLSLNLLPSGIEARWKGDGAHVVSHRLYRSHGSVIDSTDGLFPVEAVFGEKQALDTSPSPTHHTYAVTAVDSAGNESFPSGSVYLNFHLLPPDRLLVSRNEDELPVFSWTHPGGSFAGFVVSMGPPGQLMPVGEEPVIFYQMEDRGYTGDERVYHIVAVDGNGEESPGRSVHLPLVEVALSDNSLLRRGIMNRLFCDVTNKGTSSLAGLELAAGIGNRDHGSSPFNLSPGETLRVPVVVPGYAGLKDRETLSLRVQQNPEPGIRAQIWRAQTMAVGEGMLAAGIRSENMIRGGAGKVRFFLENTGSEDVEILTARSFGKNPSQDIRFRLTDSDDNTLSVVNFLQATGESVYTLATGQSLVRIPPGERFTSNPLLLPIPLSAPDDVVLRLEIDRVFHGFATDHPHELRGFGSAVGVTLVETSYAAEVVSVFPRLAHDQDVQIEGRVYERTSGRNLPHTPLNLVIMQRGFERKIALVSGSDGTFSYTFRPTVKESGTFEVAALHPDLMERPVQAAFTIARVGLYPSRIRLTLPKNYEESIPIQVEVAEGTGVSNLRFVYDESDQPANAFMEGLSWDGGSPIEVLDGGRKAWVHLRISGSNQVAEHGSLILRLVSEETGHKPWAHVHLDISFTEAMPRLVFPSFRETGLVPGDHPVETIRFTNRGLADAEGLRFTLKGEGGGEAPDWVILNHTGLSSLLRTGESLDVPVTLVPPLRTREGLYTFFLTAEADNHPAVSIPFYVSVTQNGRGHVLFKVQNIYTGSLGPDNEAIQGLKDASIVLQHEKNLSFHFNAKSDGHGEALLRDLPAGIYKYRVRAAGHQETTGRVWIKPGITVSEALFLEYNFVTVEWRVVETTLQDSYDIVLTMIYETNVPAPVVVCEPGTISLPDLKAGDVFTGEFVCTNHGLIAADNLAVQLPENDSHIQYQLLSGVPAMLGAKESIRIPYRLVTLRSLDPADEMESGGGSGGAYRACVYTSYQGVAANGCPYSGRIPHCFTRPWRTSAHQPAPGSPGGGGISWGGGMGGGGWGSSGIWTPAAREIATDEGSCDPLPGGGREGESGSSTGASLSVSGSCQDAGSGSRAAAESECGDCVHWASDECGKYRCVPVGSSVLPLTGEFVHGETDLWVQAQGGRLGLVRNYSYGNWDFNIHSRIWSVFEGSEGEDAKDPTRLFFNGYAYEKSGTGTYIRGRYRILIHKRDSSGRPSAYRYESSSGAWELFETHLESGAFGLSSWGNIHG
ncbi:Ig-like domain-containing protein, partial [Desulfobotulus sp. H1]